MEFPKIILLFSGKRKSGKDYICEKLKTLLGEKKCVILRISGPLKSLYAANHNLNLNELMSEGPYKENYRVDMIKWSDEVRATNPGYFCQASCDSAPAKPIWIISDVRRKTDVKWFRETYGYLIRIVRISADLEIRKQRGWIYTEGVDNVASECDLDDYIEWNLQINNNTLEETEDAINQLLFILKENNL